jgi:hypothetical protein
VHLAGAIVPLFEFVVDKRHTLKIACQLAQQRNQRHLPSVARHVLTLLGGESGRNDGEFVGRFLSEFPHLRGGLHVSGFGTWEEEDVGAAVVWWSPLPRAPGVRHGGIHLCHCPDEC